MCVTCLAFSAMTLFSPVTEAPQPTSLNPSSLSDGQASQVKPMPVAEETRASITQMLKRMPNSPETQILREEFSSLQAKLAGVKDDTKADMIINDGLDTLSKRVMAAPNSDRIIEVLFEMGEAGANSQMNSIQSKLLQGPSSSVTSFKGQSGSWGWLS